MKKFAAFLDNMLTIIILLSIAQIFVGDLSVIYGWFSADLERDTFDRWMIIAGFSFDVIFSIEFIVRSLHAIKHHRFKEYFFYNRGWIDFLASLPLLLTNSLPQFLALVLANRVSSAGRGILNALKAVKAVRVTRILRLLRTLKIFGKIENVSSKMSQHHVATISSLVVTVSVAVFMLFSFLGFLDMPSPVIEARISFVFTILLIANILFVAFFYSRHFAQNVSDPIYVIKRGMLEQKYNFTARIKEHYKDEEVFELARAYNTVWLPMKVRIQKLRDEKLAKEVMPVQDDDYSDLLD